MKITGNARSSSIDGKITLGCHRPIIAQNAAVRIATIAHSEGLTPEMEEQSQSAETGASKKIGAFQYVIGWGAEVTDMISRTTGVSDMTGQGAGPIGTTDQRTESACTIGWRRWLMLRYQTRIPWYGNQNGNAPNHRLNQ